MQAATQSFNQTDNDFLREARQALRRWGRWAARGVPLPRMAGGGMARLQDYGLTPVEHNRFAPCPDAIAESVEKVLVAMQRIFPDEAEILMARYKDGMTDASAAAHLHETRNLPKSKSAFQIHAARAEGVFVGLWMQKP
ncbi:antiterminator Q family protein [Magnetofaba australis]|uniref:Phage antitermination protein Q n=1 Tax=Magnetofaba australis IT-1 TaxID=1434232 RepID=A0A1Y2K443_9PROT|nr:antiterminator Q family protein [Magnetofaba australis]OSM03999.1 hypothetical protein MAIT1_03748 [Magnetofaba australis IT-1]